MRTLAPTCIEPGRWETEPDSEAPASEILAYLRHCDRCAYHATLNLEDELSLDLLLRDVCRDLDVEGFTAAGRRRGGGNAPPRRRPRAERTPRLPERASFERRLTLACIVAFGIVVAWISFTAALRDGDRLASAPGTPVDSLSHAAAPDPGRPLDVMDRGSGRLYISRVMGEAQGGQSLRNSAATVEEPMTAVVPLMPPGTLLRITNPLNGAFAVVKVVGHSYTEREIHLSPPALEMLGLGGPAIVFVEVISVPEATSLAP